MKTWQMACRLEEIPNVGDFQIYEIIDQSVLVVRSESDRVQAFYNSCLHRGRKLATQPGHKAEFRCPFHGFCWQLNGDFKESPSPWDYQHLTDEMLQLPELQVGTWGGFVFVNFDVSAKPLMEDGLTTVWQYCMRVSLQILISEIRPLFLKVILTADS